jgi:hypothetical protein
MKSEIDASHYDCHTFLARKQRAKVDANGSPTPLDRAQSKVNAVSLQTAPEGTGLLVTRLKRSYKELFTG